MMWVLMGMVLFCRPALAAGGAVSRATLRQREFREAATRFAGVSFRAELFVGEAHEIGFFLIPASLTWFAALSSLSLPVRLADCVDFLVRVCLGVASDRVHVGVLPILAEVEDLKSVFADFL